MIYRVEEWVPPRERGTWHNGYWLVVQEFVDGQYADARAMAQRLCSKGRRVRLVRESVVWPPEEGGRGGE